MAGPGPAHSPRFSLESLGPPHSPCNRRAGPLSLGRDRPAACCRRARIGHPPGVAFQPQRCPCCLGSVCRHSSRRRRRPGADARLDFLGSTGQRAAARRRVGPAVDRRGGAMRGARHTAAPRRVAMVGPAGLLRMATGRAASCLERQPSHSGNGHGLARSGKRGRRDLPGTSHRPDAGQPRRPAADRRRSHTAFALGGSRILAAEPRAAARVLVGEHWARASGTPALACLRHWAVCHRCSISESVLSDGLTRRARRLGAGLLCRAESIGAGWPAVVCEERADGG